MFTKFCSLLAFAVIILLMSFAEMPERSICEGVLYIDNAFNAKRYDLLQAKLLEKDSETSTHRGRVRFKDFKEERIEQDFGSDIAYTALYKKSSPDRDTMERHFISLVDLLQTCLNITPDRDDDAESLEATFTLKSGTRVLLTAFLSELQPKYIELEIVQDLP